MRLAGVCSQRPISIDFLVFLVQNCKSKYTIEMKFLSGKCTRGGKNTIKLIDKMSLGAGALKVEGPIEQKGSIALEVTMATNTV